MTDVTEKIIHLDLVTPERSVFSGETTQVTAPGSEGSFTLLYNHADLVSKLDVGEIRIVTPEGSTLHFACSGGFLEVKKNHVIILAITAERSEEIDLARAESARKRANELLKQKKDDIDVVRARVALLRAITRIRVHSKGL
ncbi:MAG: F0F1 ATP synthase subunit epsilon [Bacteroidetes bacterium]|nr:F0F1 ATP synthase subunit epsilon [Bacteroidota bacterium]